MKLGRIEVAAPDGDQARIVAVLEDQGRVVDLARAYPALLQRRGANASGALRVARALFPDSMSDSVLPGDLIATGALGDGSGLEIGRNLKPGDVLELQLDPDGVLKTIVGQPEVAPWWPQERPYPWREGE